VTSGAVGGRQTPGGGKAQGRHGLGVACGGGQRTSAEGKARKASEETVCYKRRLRLSQRQAGQAGREIGSCRGRGNLRRANPRSVTV
jgi:hypothetical protein